MVSKDGDGRGDLRSAPLSVLLTLYSDGPGFQRDKNQVPTYIREIGCYVFGKRDDTVELTASSYNE